MTLAITSQIADIANILTWGIEIEISKHTTRSAAIAMGRAWGTDDSVTSEGGYYEKYEVTDPNGKVWSVVTDGSVCGAEIVSPICKGLARMDGDMAALLDMLAACKFKVNDDCGVHVHIGVGDYSPRVVQALLKTVGESQDMIAKMAAGNDARYAEMLRNPCGAHHVDADTINRVVNASPTWDAIRDAWYGPDRVAYDSTPWTDRYNGSRYVGVNLHSLFVEIHGDAPRRTIEFRYFCADRMDAPKDSLGRRPVHRGKVRSAVTFAAYMVARSVYNVSQGRLPRSVTRNADKATARTFFNWLRMYDRAVIEHLIAPLPGEYTNGHNHNRGRGMGTNGIVPGCSCPRCTEGAGTD